MAKERKKRQAKKSSVDTSQLKSYGGDFKSRGEQKLSFAKRVKTEADLIQAQIVEEQEKAQEKSLWSSIGGALGGLALGLATGGSSWALQAAAAGVGTYVGAQGGKVASEAKSGKRKEITSDMFYEKEAEKQNLAFRDFDEKLNESILNRSLAAGAMTAAFVGGGEVVKNLKEAKATKELAKTAQQVETGAKVKKAAEGADYVMKTNVPTDTLDLVQARTNELGAISEGLDKGMNLSTLKVIPEASPNALALRNTSNISSSFASSLTPLADEAAPSIMDSYLKGIAGQKSKSMQQSLLAAGGMSLYGYRPELESLRQVQFGNNIKPYG